MTWFMSIKIMIYFILCESDWSDYFDHRWSSVGKGREVNRWLYFFVMKWQIIIPWLEQIPQICQENLFAACISQVGTKYYIINTLCQVKIRLCVLSHILHHDPENIEQIVCMCIIGCVCYAKKINISVLKLWWIQYRRPKLQCEPHIWSVQSHEDIRLEMWPHQSVIFLKMAHIRVIWLHVSAFTWQTSVVETLSAVCLCFLCGIWSLLFSSSGYTTERFQQELHRGLPPLWKLRPLGKKLSWTRFRRRQRRMGVLTREPSDCD